MDHLPLLLAGIVGSATAVVHGILTSRILIKPVDAALAGHAGTSSTIRRIIPALLHYSTFSWLAGGVALILAALLSDRGPRLAVSLLVTAMYTYASLANGWATRWRHPGWLLMALAVALIAMDLAVYRRT